MPDPARFRRIGLIAKHGEDDVNRTLERLVAHLRGHPIEVVMDAANAPAARAVGLPVADRTQIGETCDLVIVIAGDGTFLGAARTLVDAGVPLLGINLGRLGFLADIMPDEMADRLDEVLAGHYVEESRLLLAARVVRDGEEIFRTDALNEIVAHKWNIARLIEFETRIDDSLVSVQRSDGLIVSTPTGSTAYALSGGGPIVHPDLEAIVLVPICPHTLSSRPLVVGADRRIAIRVAQVGEREAQVSCDGQVVHLLQPGDTIVIERKPGSLRLVHPPGHDYFEMLRTKLHWGRGP